MTKNAVATGVSTRKRYRRDSVALCGLAMLVALLSGAGILQGQGRAEDPGVRAHAVSAGQPLTGLSANDLVAFTTGQATFMEVDSVGGTIPGETGKGLGPRFNSNSCVSCHAQPAAGGSSPNTRAFPFIGPNPQVAIASLNGADNVVPSFIQPNGPVREVRFINTVDSNGNPTNTPDGGVHDLFTIAGRSDATNVPGANGKLQTCTLPQPNFNNTKNIIFRIPSPLFGAGFIENISDATILANMSASANAKSQLGIAGQPNRSGNDGTITKFGWKAQNKSLGIFAGEAYNVEQGVSNELFTNERASPGEVLPTSCIFNGTPEDTTNFANLGPSDVVAFSMFLRFLDQPTPSTTLPGGAASIARGRNVFNNVAQCALCHTPQLTTSGSSMTPALNYQTANLYSDLLIHHMGSGLSDGVSQGGAGPDQFRTAPLWGLGQRVFFLHDGRTSDLVQAIAAHSSKGSEANAVIQQFNNLNQGQMQDLLNFLRSL
jgi:CxxC motif-containing protein (DUF1111 family)